MKLRWVGGCFAAAAALAAQTAGAEKPLRPADLAPLNAAVIAETAGRISADGALQGAIDAETAARIAADQDLEARLGNPARLQGRYAFSGTQYCLASSTGFRTDIELLPLLVFPPPPPTSITPTVLTPSSTTVIGVRTFNGDGTGSSVATFHTITAPATIVSGGFQSGGAAISALESTFTYEVRPDMTVLIEDDPADGLITKGGTRVGWKIRVEGAPRFVGFVSKDWKTILLHQEDLVVEQSILNSPPDVTPPQQFVTPRVCQRVRTLHKIPD